MSQSIRFLGLAIFAWVGVRAVSLGLVPGAEALAFDRPVRPDDSTPALQPPIAVPPMPQIGAVAPAYDQPPGMAGATANPYGAYPNGAYPYGYAYSYGTAPYPPYPHYPPAPTIRYVIQAPTVRPAAYAPQGQSRPEWTEIAPMPPARYFPETPVLDDFPALRAAATAGPRQSTPPLFQPPGNRVSGLDRWQLSSWAMMRSRPGPSSLASGGMLGGSQAGARLLWRFDPHLAVSARTTTPLQSIQRGTEAALGVRYQPFTSIPIAVTAERRQWIGKTPGRSGFAMFAEGGLYAKPLPLGARLDTYLQAGVVGPKDRAWFVDGAATATRPLWRGLSAGGGVWGGVQKEAALPGLARLEAGPRMSLDLGRGIKVHADYRVKLKGNAEPGTGAVVTLAGDF